LPHEADARPLGRHGLDRPGVDRAVVDDDHLGHRVPSLLLEGLQATCELLGSILRRDDDRDKRLEAWFRHREN
jgi:hypothetical protein